MTKSLWISCFGGIELVEGVSGHFERDDVRVSSFEESVTMRLFATLVSVKARHGSREVGF